MAEKEIRKHGLRWMREYNAIAVGYGYKVVKGKVTKEPAIIFYVRKKLPIGQLLVRGIKPVPRHLKGHKTDVIEVPEGFKVRADDKKYKPILGGVAGINFRIRGTGTLGLINSNGEILCYDPETYCLTSVGWKPISNIKVGELVASLNPKTRSIEYYPVTATYKYAYRGPMMYFNGHLYNLLVTPNHRMLVEVHGKIHFHVADDPCLKTRQYFIKTGRWEGIEPKYFEIPLPRKRAKQLRKLEPIPIESWVKFMAWYLAEGWCDYKNIHHGMIVISQKEKEYVDEIYGLFSDVGLNPKLRRHGGVYRIVAYSQHLASYLRPLGKSIDHTRKIPIEIKKLSPNLLRLFIKTFALGDGHIYKDSNGKFFASLATSSKQLALDLSEVAIKAGYASGIQFTIQKGGYKPGGPKYTVNVYNSRKIHGKYNPSRVEKIDYEGLIYGIEVPPHHNLLVMRKGKIVWSGNSNNHVLSAGCTNVECPVERGDCILQPGYHGGAEYPRDCCGVLDRWVPILVKGGPNPCRAANLVAGFLNLFPKLMGRKGRFKYIYAEEPENLVDAAVAKATVEYKPMEIVEIGEVDGATRLELGDEVIKRGRTTEYTEGYVAATNVQVRVAGYAGDTEALFVDQVAIYSTDESKPFSQPGDSGSAIIKKDDKSVGGLLFAGGTDIYGRDVTIANRIEHVVRLLGFRVS